MPRAYRQGLVAVCVWLGTSAAGLACVIDYAVCVTPSTGLQATDINARGDQSVPYPSSLVITQQSATGKPDEDVLMVHCPSRTSVLVPGGQKSGDVSTAIDIMQEMIDTPEKVTFRTLRNQLKAAGYTSVNRAVAKDLCACDPGFPALDRNCGDGP